MAHAARHVEVVCEDLRGIFDPDTSLVFFSGDDGPCVTANDFERLAGRKSNNWKKTLTVVETAETLAAWAARTRACLHKPDAGAAAKQCIVWRADKPRARGVPSGWIAAEHLLAGCYVHGHVQRSKQGGLTFTAVYPAGASEGRTRRFDPELEAWYPLGGTPLANPELLERMSQLKHLQPLWEASERDVAALQAKLGTVGFDICLQQLPPECKHAIWINCDKRDRSNGSIRVKGTVTHFAARGSLSAQGFLRKADHLGTAIRLMLLDHSHRQEPEQLAQQQQAAQQQHHVEQQQQLRATEQELPEQALVSPSWSPSPLWLPVVDAPLPSSPLSLPVVEAPTLVLVQVPVVPFVVKPEPCWEPTQHTPAAAPVPYSEERVPSLCSARATMEEHNTDDGPNDLESLLDLLPDTNDMGFGAEDDGWGGNDVLTHINTFKLWHESEPPAKRMRL